MSTTRDSILYRDIQEILEKKLPEHGYPILPELIGGVLAEYFDSIAIHLWSRDDVIHILKRQGWPISINAVDEILSNIERHIDCELGITWQTLEIAISDFYGSIDWWELSKEKRAQYRGDFILKLEPDENLLQDKSLAELLGSTFILWQGVYRPLKDKTMQEAFIEAERIVRDSHIPLRLYAIEPDYKLKEGVEENGKEMADFHPDYFEEESEDE